MQRRRQIPRRARGDVHVALGRSHYADLVNGQGEVPNKSSSHAHVPGTHSGPIIVVTLVHVPARDIVEVAAAAKLAYQKCSC